MSTINFLLILILAGVFANYIFHSINDNDRYMKYFGDLERRIDILSNRVSELEKKWDTDYEHNMKSLFELHNELNRTKMRVGRLEQNNDYLITKTKSLQMALNSFYGKNILLENYIKNDIVETAEAYSKIKEENENEQ